MAGEKLGGTLADERDADAVDEALEAVLFAGGDFIEQILGGFFGHAIEIGERLEIELIDIGVVFYQVFLDELVDDFFAEAVDVHGVATGKMKKRFPSASATGNVDAAIGYFAFGAVDARAANRAFVRHLELLFFCSMLDDLEHVRNYFASALDENRIAGVDIEAFDFVHVMEGGLRNGEAADLHGLENRERGEHAGAADADCDLSEERSLLMRCVFICDGPARRFRSEAELVLQADFVNFDHDAIDFIFQFFALRFPCGEIFLDFRKRMTDFPIVARFEAESRERFENLREALLGAASVHEHVIGKEIEAARGGDAGIEHADRTGCCVARIGKYFAALLGLEAIHFLESVAGHDYFAAHFEVGRNAGFFQQDRIDTQRNRADCFYVRCDVFSGGSVAPRNASNQRAIFVNQGEAETVKLVLGHVIDSLAACGFAYATIKGSKRFE